uniref:Uncharacterized protein n=1 Tax=Heterorhabditis bacteriophora TaxID=37862 RepID=A0A1I7WD89_HETBA
MRCRLRGPAQRGPPGGYVESLCATSCRHRKPCRASTPPTGPMPWCCRSNLHVQLRPQGETGGRSARGGARVDRRCRPPAAAAALWRQVDHPGRRHQLGDADRVGQDGTGCLTPCAPRARSSIRVACCS